MIVNQKKYKQMKDKEVTKSNILILNIHCVKSVRIWSYSCPHFSAFGLRISPYSVRMWENVDQNNSKYIHFLHSDFELT